MKLHAFTLSPNSRKSECLIGYLGLDVAIHQVALLEGEQKGAAFLAMNPNGKIPVLDADGFHIWESNAILNYLAALRPDSGLLPADIKARSSAQRWEFWQCAHIGGAVARVVDELLFKPLRNLEPDMAAVEKGKAELDVHAGILNTQLADKEYLCGPLTVADFVVAPTAETAAALGVDYAPYPHLQGWLERLAGLKGWITQPPLPVGGPA